MNDVPLPQAKSAVAPAQFTIVGPLAAAFTGLFPGVFVLVVSTILGGVFGGSRSGQPTLSAKTGSSTMRDSSPAIGVR